MLHPYIAYLLLTSPGRTLKRPDEGAKRRVAHRRTWREWARAIAQSR